jgi:drug/metabolite transporter (DMT)-like permease
MHQKVIPLVIYIFAISLYATLGILFKRADQMGLKAFSSMAVSMFFLFSPAFIAAMYFEGFPSSIPKQNLWLPIALVVTAGLINFVGFRLTILSYKSFTLFEMGLLSFLGPIFTALFSYVFLKEHVNVQQIIGYLIIMAGVTVSLLK